MVWTDSSGEQHLILFGGTSSYFGGQIFYGDLWFFSFTSHEWTEHKIDPQCESCDFVEIHWSACAFGEQGTTTRHSARHELLTLPMWNARTVL